MLYTQEAAGCGWVGGVVVGGRGGRWWWWGAAMPVSGPASVLARYCQNKYQGEGTDRLPGCEGQDDEWAGGCSLGWWGVTTCGADGGRGGESCWGVMGCINFTATAPNRHWGWGGLTVTVAGHNRVEVCVLDTKLFKFPSSSCVCGKAERGVRMRPP